MLSYHGEAVCLSVWTTWCQSDPHIPSLGMMFLTRKASQAPGVNTSFQGCRMRRAEASLGCQRCRALASLLRMGGYRGSSRDWSRGNQGWSQEWMGTVSVKGFQLSTCESKRKHTMCVNVRTYYIIY